ncbi:putative cyclase [Punctularia strigosozonata HHB-11173 SS5]|uniref:putative cyclase n=1 Tax=Punctularia strigosozonata (strain HHB-11173) TaxID=741275 RepID=UPI0004417DA4|nr:putative cyclase [Punctularia strigosozonata HHB-11173 SS5]EIN06591.1 putative cyclase [Punctularia strigosozonata HHB-11173 SS5]
MDPKATAIVDLTHDLDGTTVLTCTGHPSFCCQRVLTIEEYGSNVSTIQLGSHTGTHIDAPYHFFHDGKTVDQLPVETFVGPVLVIDLTGKNPRQRVTWEDFNAYQSRMKEGVVVLFRFGWSAHWGSQTYFDHPFLDKEAITRVMDTGVRVIGVDTLSPDETSLDGAFDVHRVVLGAGGVIAENLTNLDALEEWGFIVSLLPLYLRGSDGSPIRAVAWRQ